MDLVKTNPAIGTGAKAAPLPTLHGLRAALATGLTAQAVAEQVIARRRAVTAEGIWITPVSDQALRERARQLDAAPQGPLFAIPFAVKDNIDVAGLPTTAGCPAFAYTPESTAPAVQKLLDAGAMLVGKTNLDQFATGLTGTRSPYGIPANAFDADYISGGSSSGSALAVAHGLVCFALGTDTAGSGRVPAALGNLVGLKPSRGLVSARGVLPACRSLDCVSVFAPTSADAQAVLAVIAGVDVEDPFSRVFPAAAATTGTRFRFGIPQPAQREFFADGASLAAFERAIDTLVALGGDPVEVDYAPFREAARLLYEGPWLAERYLAIREFLDHQPEALLPVVRQIIEGGSRFRATDAFAAQYRLLALSQMLRAQWLDIDLLVTPTIPTPYTRAAVLADPLTLNDRLGYYTNHVNLLDLCAVAVPAGFLPNGLPFGVTLQAPAGNDRALLLRADRLHRAINETLGATGLPLADTAPMTGAMANADVLAIAVCGGHMQGLPLNAELTSLGGELLARTRTAPAYRLYALAGFSPARPGLVRDAAGASIEVEVWTLPLANVGTFLAGVPAPLAIGSVELADGGLVKGFLCEAHAIAGARDISALGGWRAWLANS
ncbi:MAG: allophanate hydrolase [Gammaproteobacteria bacterium]|nr:allophanate hydrolase [Gammaproteobacteria bacterium]